MTGPLSDLPKAVADDDVEEEVEHSDVHSDTDDDRLEHLSCPAEPVNEMSSDQEVEEQQDGGTNRRKRKLCSVCGKKLDRMWTVRIRLSAQF